MQNMFLELKGPDLKGPSTADVAKDQIDILSWSHRVSMPLTYAATGQRRTHGKCVLQDFTISKYMDLTTPSMNKSCCAGETFKTATLSIYIADAADAKPLLQYKIVMDEALVTSVSIGGGGGDQAIETVTFNFTKITWDYTGQKPDATKAGVTSASWDSTKIEGAAK